MEAGRNGLAPRLSRCLNMPRPSLPPERHRNISVATNVDMRDADLIDDLADRQGLSRAAWIRRAVRAALDAETTEVKS